MTRQIGIITESTIFRYLLLFLLFIYLAFDRDLANIYMLMILADYVWYRTDLIAGNKKTDLPTEHTATNRYQAVASAIIAFAVLLVVTQIAFNASTETASIANFQSIIVILASATPILKGSIILTVLGWGFLASTVETRFFFGRVFEGLAYSYEELTGEKISLNKFTVRTVILMAFVAGLFTLFHITAKHLSDVALIITFIFAMISMVLVVRDQELKSSILLHIITNTIAVLASLKLLGLG